MVFQRCRLASKRLGRIYTCSQFLHQNSFVTGKMKVPYSFTRFTRDGIFNVANTSFYKNNTIVFQEKSGNRTAQFESGSLALKYRLDNEFELVFIAAFQKMLPLLYLDKLLDEIQKLFRDKFASALQVGHLIALYTKIK